MPTPDDMKAAREVFDSMQSVIGVGPITIAGDTRIIAEALSAARERGAKDERERLRLPPTDHDAVSDLLSNLDVRSPHEWHAHIASALDRAAIRARAGK